MKRSHKVKNTETPSRHEVENLLAAYNTQNFELAEKYARLLTQFYPNHVFGWSALGAVLAQSSRLKDAIVPLRKATQLDPENPDSQNNLGVALKELNYPIEAEEKYRKAILLRPDYPEAYNNLGVLLGDLGKQADAISCYKRAISLKPEYAEAYANLGNSLTSIGRLLDAESAFREAIRLKPNFAQAYNGLSNSLHYLGKLEQAEMFSREAIRLKQDYVEAYNNLAVILKDLRRFKEAETTIRTAIDLKPDTAEAHSNLGVVLKDLGRLSESEISYRKAIHLKPDLPKFRSNLLFSLNYGGTPSTGSALKEAQEYGSIVSKRAQQKFTLWEIPKQTSKLRVGFVSGDLRNHPVGYFIEGLVTHLDPNRFDLFAFPTTPVQDDLTARITPFFGEWIPIFGKSDFEAASIIHSKKIHILIDLSGHSAHNRLPVFSYRPAPIQASWLGYFATTGLPEMDYFFGDPIMSPKSEATNFSEQIWNLPDTWLCLSPPAQLIPIAPLPMKINGFITFGCFGTVPKMGGAVVKTWSEILNRIPNSKLFLKARQLNDQNSATEVIKRFQAFGISADRLILEGSSPRIEYFMAYNRVDLVLDTFPYPGGTTSVDALWMGVPVLTKKGDRFLSRLGESIVTNAGLKDFVAIDTDDYINKAVSLAFEPQALESIKSELRARVLNSPLFDVERFARGFGETLWAIWHSHKVNETHQ